MVKYTVNCQSAGSELRYADRFDDWTEARRHLVGMVSAYYADFVEGHPDLQCEAGQVVRAVVAWVPGTAGSVTVKGDDAVFFLYPVVDEEDRSVIACPRCLLGIEATRLEDGEVVGGPDGPVAFGGFDRVVYRITCESDCAESGEHEGLFDALDAFYSTVMEPRPQAAGSVPAS